MSGEETADVIVTRSGRLGEIVLNRPKAINALTLEMVRAIDGALTEFLSSDVTTVAIRGAGERGMCAGGDIRAIYDAMLAHDPAPRTFWREEYRLNARIARYPKPIVAVMDGIVMGGGVGLGGHAALRLVTERTVVAMPEVGIGFAPDVGGTWLLALAPGETGTYAALTGARLGPADTLACGLAGYFAPAHLLPSVLAALTEGDPYQILAEAAGGDPVPAIGVLGGWRSWIDHCFAGGTVEEIIDRLRASEDRHAHQAADEMASKSPTSLKVTLRALRQARARNTLEGCLEMEYRISTTFLGVPDFREGVRAAIVDKDRHPRWSPGRVEEVSEATVERFFARREDELHLAVPDLAGP